MTTRQTTHPAVGGPSATTPSGSGLAHGAERPISLAVDLWHRSQAHDLTGLAAELAYRFLFALFPFGLFLTALAAYVAVVLGLGDPTGAIINGLGSNVPPELAGTVQRELQQVIGQQRLTLLTSGAFLALWAATTGTMTVIKAMNRAYGVRETRPMLRRYALGLALTIGGSIAILVAFATIVGGGFLTEKMVAGLGLGAPAWGAISVLRWPIIGALLVGAAAVIYRYGPNLRPTWRTALIGGLVFAVGWLVATFLLSVYVSRIQNYDATYGALAGIIVLMVWMYLTGMVLLVGAEIVAIRLGRSRPELIAQRQAETGAVDVVARTRVVAVEALANLHRAADEQARAAEEARAARTGDTAGARTLRHLNSDGAPPGL